MKLTYSDKKVETQCTSLKEAQKLFGGNKILAIKLIDVINRLESDYENKIGDYYTSLIVVLFRSSS